MTPARIDAAALHTARPEIPLPGDIVSALSATTRRRGCHCIVSMLLGLRWQCRPNMWRCQYMRHDCLP